MHIMFIFACLQLKWLVFCAFLSVDIHVQCVMLLLFLCSMFLIFVTHASMAVPSAAMEATKRRLKELQQEVHKVQRQKRKLEKVEEKEKMCRTFHIQVMCKASTTEAQQYLHMQGCMRDDGHAWSRESMLEAVGKTLVEPFAHCCPSSEDHATSDVVKAAQSFLLSSETFRWVKEQNEKKGIAAMMQTTLNKYRRLQTHDFTEALEPNLPKTESGQYKWTRRWARKWKLWKGKLKAGQVLPPEQRRDKAKS